MKIWGNIPKVSGVYGNSGKIEKSSRVGEIASKKDELTISGTAKDFSVVMRALRNVPDVREDRVAEVSKKMDQGSYQVASGDVASKIVDMLQNKKV